METDSDEAGPAGALQVSERLCACRRHDVAAAAALQLAKAKLAAARARLDTLLAQLHQLSPLRVLERGYAIATDDAGRVLKDPRDAPPDSDIRVLLARGRLQARVTVAQPAPRRTP